MATVACSACARPVPVGARFCPSCGTPVAHSATAIEERRVVTVLFADLVGYTALAEHLDPEAVTRLIESCFQPLVVEIEAFGGRVDKVLGDAIIALFGAPVAHEDDADRAVRAALRMQETLCRLVDERVEAGDPVADIQMRIGINTGEVLVGTVAGSDYTAMGDVVNTASRLQALAPPGSVLIGAATEALCSTAVARQPFGETHLRGRQQAEQPWLITGAAAAGTRPVRCDIPFVGRLDELALLESIISLVRTGHSGVVTIVGEPGCGKTRIADHIVTQLADEAIVVETACAPYGETSLWSPLRNGLATLLALDPNATADDVRSAVEQRSKELWSLQPGDELLDRLLGVVGYLFGHPSELDELDPAGVRDRVTSVVTEAMRSHAQTRMTVLWVDNLQWADPMVRDLLAVVVRSLADLPFLLITSQRSDDDLAWPPPQLDRSLLLRVPLGPLSLLDAATLVRLLLERDGTAELPIETLVDELVERGGGNPLFLVELAALAIGAPSQSELPGSLRALIAARLDQLSPTRRAVVDNAAVLGPSGSTMALEEFASAMQQEFSVNDVQELAADGIFELDGGWWRFRSDVVREVAYQTLTKRTRAQRHAGVAMALAAEKGEYLHLIEDLAHHAATAAELVAELGRVPGVPRSLPRHAVQALHKAAQAALDAGRAEHAIRHAGRALALCDDDQDTRRQLLLIRATAELDMRQFPAASADARHALESALADDDEIAEGEARRRLGTVAHMQGDLATSRRQLDAAVDIFRRAGDDKRLANALRARGFAEVFGGSIPAARTYLGEAMALFGQLGDERGQAWAGHNMAWAAFQGGDYADAELLLEESRRRFEKLGDRVGGHWAEGLLAYVTYFQRRFDEAETLASAVIGDAKRWGDAWALLMMQTLLANMRLWTGRIAEAEVLAERALAGFRESDDRYGVMSALGPLTRAQVALGKNADAQRGAEESISLGHSFGELGLALQGAAAVAMHLGDAEQALVLAEQVLARHHAMGASDAEAVVVRSLALSQLARVDEAVAAIEEIDVEDFPFGQAARSLVRALAGDHAGAQSDAEAVENASGASYFDLALGRLGGVVAALRTDDVSLRRHWFEQLRSIATGAGDVIFVGLSQALAREPATVPESLGSGWKRIVEQAVSATGSERIM
jgi:class 3 adenylate cyclase/tetratricopeptide (TPR) repeat protein